MANTSGDFKKLVKEYLQQVVGQNKKCSVTALTDDSMNEELIQLGKQKGKKRGGISMKIKFDCPKCHREWTSAYGNT